MLSKVRTAFFPALWVKTQSQVQKLTSKAGFGSPAGSVILVGQQNLVQPLKLDLIQVKYLLRNLINTHAQSKTMNYDNKKTAGLLIFVGAAQFILAVIVSETVYSSYSVGQQAISDLGNWSLAGNSAAILDVSVILMGIFIIAGTYFIQQLFRNRLFTSLLFIYGIGLVGVGVVAEDIFLPIHAFFALALFLFGAVSAIMSYKFVKSPLSKVSVILGAVALLAFFLSFSGAFSSGFYLGLGSGGMERFIVYPILLWLLGFGAYLIGDSSNTT
jgi:hypothetical membrane protein